MEESTPFHMAKMNKAKRERVNDINKTELNRYSDQINGIFRFSYKLEKCRNHTHAHRCIVFHEKSKSIQSRFTDTWHSIVLKTSLENDQMPKCDAIIWKDISFSFNCTLSLCRCTLLLRQRARCLFVVRHFFRPCYCSNETHSRQVW